MDKNKREKRPIFKKQYLATFHSLDPVAIVVTGLADYFFFIDNVRSFKKVEIKSSIKQPAWLFVEWRGKLNSFNHRSS